MDETIKQGKGALRLLLATMLAAMLIPWAPRAAWADENEAAAQTQTSEIADLLAAGDYVEGEALVVVDNAASRNSLRSRSVDPLSSAEPLMDASAETYATATGVDVPLEQSVSNGPVLLRSARSLPEDDAVSMVLVRQEGTSTEDLLRQLQDDPRILSAEPNYVQRLDDPIRRRSMRARRKSLRHWGWIRRTRRRRLRRARMQAARPLPTCPATSGAAATPEKSWCKKRRRPLPVSTSRRRIGTRSAQRTPPTSLPWLTLAWTTTIPTSTASCAT